MKQFLIFFITMSASIMSAHAQTGLNIEKVFGGRYHDNPAAAESMIQGNDDLENQGIYLIRTLRITGQPEEANFIEPLVVADGAKAVEKTVSYKKGMLYLGIYSLQPAHKQNRHIIYLNQKPTGGDKINLIYIEGSITKEKISTMIK